MRWTGKLAVVGLVALMTFPTAYTLQQDSVVTGHVTYAAMDGFDPCIAGIAGIVRLRVMWFNDQVLFERAADEGSWVYATEAGAPDPRDQMLVPTGEKYEFVDPNNVDWAVTEYTFTGVEAQVYPPNEHHDILQWGVWVVKTGPTVRDYAATGRSYNFVNLVDTCKFNAAGHALAHSHDGSGNWTSSEANDTTENQHLANDPDHAHESYQVNLYVGPEPQVLVPANKPVNP